MELAVFDVSLLSPAKPLAFMKAKQVLAPGVQGEMGILAGHASLLSQLKPGILRIECEDDRKSIYYFVSGGILEFFSNKATILVETAEAPDEIDLARAEAAEKRALERLKETTNQDINIGRALAALERAKARKQLKLLTFRSKH